MQVPPQDGYGSPPVHGVKQRQSPLMARHSVPARLQVPSHTGVPLPPEHVGGRQNAGMPGAGPTHDQPSGQPFGHGPVGGALRQAQFVICTPPQQVNVSA